jgi:tetratricopeptide (TPR) repeat protein
MPVRVYSLVFALLLVTGAGCAGRPGPSSASGRVPTPGEAEEARARYEEGLADLQAALQANRRAAPAQFALARKAFERCLRLDPGNLDAQVKLVEVLDGLDQEKDLLERLRAVLAVDSLHVEANEQLANRTYGVVISFVTVGVMEAVKSKDVMTSRQRTLLRSQGVRYAELEDMLLEARAICERLLRIAPADPRYLCALGAVMNLQGDYAGARNVYYRVQRSNPDFLQGNDFHNTVFAVSRENRIFVSASPRSFLHDLGGRAFRLIR